MIEVSRSSLKTGKQISWKANPAGSLALLSLF